MNTVLAALILLVIGQLSAYWLAVPTMRRFALQVYTGGFVLLFVVLGLVNHWLPFSGGGDDHDYYRLSGLAGSLEDAFNTDLFTRHMAQPGFVMLLNVFNIVFDPGLLGFKVFNLTVFLLVVQVWTRIVAEIEGVKAARRYALCGVLLTPLWFYFFFLLKDLTIALLLSGFVLGTVMAWKSPRSPLGWMLQVAAVVAVMPFRAPLAAQALAVMTVSYLVRSFQGGSIVKRLVAILLGISMTAIVAYLATSPIFLRNLGVESEARVLGSDAMLEHAMAMSDKASVNKVLFPVLYLMTEVSALNPRAWSEPNASLVRGILAIPWILFGIPALLLGFAGLAGRVTNQGSRVRVRPTLDLWATRMLSTPWLIVVTFIASSVAISWVVGDTTRWRIADMPALLAVAISATCVFPRRQMFAVVVYWCISISILFLLVAFFRGI